ncbi:DsbA family oxidoreductase, partial [Lactobacillus hominis]|uniref:DsbA family oxidoreductase n=1 Tax=Lactobacillus hominis TaxID=1203033 RepID=UPI0024BB007D
FFFLYVFFVQTNHTRKELLFLMFKEINLRNHSSLHKLFYSLVLEEIGQAAGLNGKEIIRMLSSNAYKKAVIAQTAHFNDLGESSLPFFIIGKKSFAGIQPRQVFADALNKDADEFVNARL